MGSTLSMAEGDSNEKDGGTQAAPTYTAAANGDTSDPLGLEKPTFRPFQQPRTQDAVGVTLTAKNAPSGYRVAVIGGSFDPITDGHLKAACEIVHADVADEVWIVPCGTRPDKPSLKTPYMHRLLMCHLAVNTTFGSTFPIRVSDIELGEEVALSTYHLMKKLQEAYPDPTFLFVIGADLVDSIKTWEAPGVPDAGERLYRNGSFIVLERPGYDLPATLPSNFRRLRPQQGHSIVTENVSSSEIRSRISSRVVNYGESERQNLQHGNYRMVDGLLSPAVLAHIIRYQLYSPARS